jgi:hypothetical protein
MPTDLHKGVVNNSGKGLQLDPEHVKALSAAIDDTEKGRREIKFDLDYMIQSMDRLSLWERGLLAEALVRAGNSRRPSRTQRALLALFIHRGGDHE